MTNQEPLDLQDFRQRFATEDACIDRLFMLRWLEGYTCPRCGHGQCYFLSQRKLYQCKKCKHQASVSSGTIFDKTRIPLTKWFLAIFLMAVAQPDIPILQLEPILGIRSYKTLWLMAHKIRAALDSGSEKSVRRGLSQFDNALVLCLSSDPTTFADLKA